MTDAEKSDRGLMRLWSAGSVRGCGTAHGVMIAAAAAIERHLHA